MNEKLMQDMFAAWLTTERGQYVSLLLVEKSDVLNVFLDEMYATFSRDYSGPLKSLGRRIFQNAMNKGFWDKGPLTELIPEKIALIHSEVSEAFEEYRNGHRADEIYYKDGKPEGIPIELADALIRILDFAAGYGIDMDTAVKIKMDYNANRPYKHGGKKA